MPAQRRSAEPRRHSDVLRAQILNTVVGLVLGYLVSTSLTALSTGSRLTRIETQLDEVRETLKRLQTPTLKP